MVEGEKGKETGDISTGGRVRPPPPARAHGNSLKNKIKTREIWTVLLVGITGPTNNLVHFQ